MSEWRRFSVPGTGFELRLLPHVVVLTQHEWYTAHSNVTDLNGNHLRREFKGVDVGGDVYLIQSLHDAMMAIPTINAYCVQRRALRHMATGMNESNVPEFVRPGDTYVYHELKFIQHHHLGTSYDVCISFETAREAVAFRMMVQGVVE